MVMQLAFLDTTLWGSESSSDRGDQKVNIVQPPRTNQAISTGLAPQHAFTQPCNLEENFCNSYVITLIKPFASDGLQLVNDLVQQKQPGTVQCR